MSSNYADAGLLRCPRCQMPMSGAPESHLPDCDLRKLQEEHEAAAVEAEREKVCKIVQTAIPEGRWWAQAVRDIICLQIHALPITGALDRLIAGVYLAAVQVCSARAEMRDKYECDCRGYTRASEHNAEEISNLAPADAQAALDRALARARLDEAQIADTRIAREHLEAHRKRVAWLQAELEKELKP